jgi:hypothetical protein
MKSSVPEQPTPCHCIGPSKSSMAKGDSNRRDFPVQLWNQGQMTAMSVKVSSCLHVFILQIYRKHDSISTIVSEQLCTKIGC